MINVIGHKNPDTDSVVSAVMMSRYLKEEGKETKPLILGDANKETEFVFTQLNEDIPQKITEEDFTDSSFFLVDHNDLSQSVATMNKIIGILDHHNLSGMKTDSAMYFRVEPLGSTCTLIYKMMKEKNMEVDKKGASLLLAGIISDTLNLTSGTTTSEDIDSYYELTDISGIDAISLANDMFERKSDFSDMSAQDIVTADMKEYSFGGKKIGVGVAETTSLKFFENNEEEVLKAIKDIKEKEKFDAFFFGVLDIINQNTNLYPGGDEERKIIPKIFNGEEKDSFFFLRDVSSRKKEIVPPLSEYYEEL